MSTLRTALAAQRLVENHPAWALLRADHAHIAVAVLGEHLAGDVRRRAAPDLFDLVDADLEELRAQGFSLPRPAQQYCSAWLSSGFLVRRAGEAREETYELSEGALVAIRFVKTLDEPRQAVTESRLSTILDQVRRLALETDPNTTTRLAALQAERARIDAQIDAVASGDFDVLAADRALERTLDVLAMAQEIPEDFARVRAELEQINRSLRAQLIEQPESRGTVLDDVFRGVDHLAESDAGRSFSGFYSLILDTERAAAFEDDVGELLDRAFATGLSATQARLLRRMLPSLQGAGTEIHDVMTSFSRSLRRFVQSQELAEDRRIHRLLGEALAEARVVAQHVQPFRQTALSLDLTSVAVGNLSEMRLYNPADDQTAQSVESHPAEPMDVSRLRELARASEIDLRELTANINAVLAVRGAATIAEVLDARPATQGVASVVGLLVLAEKRAVRIDGEETVSWPGPASLPRRGTVPVYLFKEEPP